MAKIQIKSEKLTPFGGFFHVMELFERHLSHSKCRMEPFFTYADTCRLQVSHQNISASLEPDAEAT